MFKYAIIALGLLSGASAASAEVSINFLNSSDWDIHHLYVSSVGENEWGPDQLGDGKEDVISNGESFTLTHIEEGAYDFKLVDEDGDECVVGGVKVKSSGSVDITNKDLISCQKETAKEAESDGE